ncbi:hypothetical protein B0H19DRAFT_1070759 [Mycena capillaripes]|nr:hypothetical protein B0H19DRAFT_1070759 [Mycena capillaripes]
MFILKFATALQILSAIALLSLVSAGPLPEPAVSDARAPTPDHCCTDKDPRALTGVEPFKVATGLHSCEGYISDQANKKLDLAVPMYKSTARALNAARNAAEDIEDTDGHLILMSLQEGKKIVSGDAAERASSPTFEKAVVAVRTLSIFYKQQPEQGRKDKPFGASLDVQHRDGMSADKYAVSEVGC